MSARTAMTPGRIAAAVALGVSATLACAAATAVPFASSAEIHPLTTPPLAQTGTLAPGADPLATADGGPPDGGDSGAPSCPNGALVDPHRGFVRCLGPGERSPFSPDPDAGAPGNPDASPPADGGGPSDAASGNTTDAAAPDAGPADAAVPDAAPSPPKPGPVPLVEMKAPKFENGDVPKAEKNLTSKKVLDAIAKCVSDAGGLTAKTGSLKVELLVRLRGKAEGVEVTPTGVPQEAARCVRTLLKNRAVGTPTADPVGVTVIYTLKPDVK
jgi:hypothetical protein